MLLLHSTYCVKFYCSTFIQMKMQFLYESTVICWIESEEEKNKKKTHEK